MTDKKNVYHSNFFAMGTRMDIVLPLVDAERGDMVFNKLKNETMRLEKKLSRFDSESEIYKINQNAHERPYGIDDELFSILKKSMSYFESTKGYFDITTRPLLESYIKDTADSEFRALKNNLGFDKIILEQNSIFLKNDIIEFDLGGFGKGYALEKIKNILTESDIESAFISFGESSILALGKHPFGEHWGVGIKHLFDHKNVYTFKVRDKSLSTSGITPANQKKNGGQAHIVNPKTGKKSNENKTTTVVSNSPLDAEILSTALMICNDSEKQEIINNFDIDDVVEIFYDADRSYSCNHCFKKD